MTPRRRFLTFGLGALAGCGGGAGGASIAASEPQATPQAVPQAGLALPAAFQLFGPVQMGAGLSYVLPSLWQFPGSALTASTKLIRFDLHIPRVKWALWRMVWTTESTVQAARLVHADDGPQNVTEIARIDGKGRGLHVADNQAIDVTDAFNGLRGGAYKNLGMQLFGDGVSNFILWESRIELAWEL